MKKKAMYIIFAALLIISALCVSSIQNWQIIKITMVSQDPDPVEPGQYVDVRFKIENEGSGPAEDVKIRLKPEYPFSLDGEGEEKDIGTLQGRQMDEEAVIVKYRIRVDENAVEGENEIRLEYKEGSNKWIELEPFNIEIRTRDIVLGFDEITSEPEIISPGKQADISIKITNNADSAVKDIKVKMDLSGDDVPFVPLKTTTEKKIYQLGSRESDTLDYRVIAEPDAEAGAYKIPLEISYYDETGQKVESSDIIGLRIGSVPDISITLDESNILSTPSLGDITIRFTNKGLNDIKLVNVIAEESKSYSMMSPSEVYVGNIDSDDYETAEFKIYAEKSEEDIEFPITYSYYDSNNKEYEEQATVTIPLYSGKKAKALQGNGGNSWIGILIVLAIVGAGSFWYYKKRKKGKK